MTIFKKVFVSSQAPTVNLVHKLALITACIQKTSMTVFVSPAICLVFGIEINATFACVLPSGWRCFFSSLNIIPLFSSLCSWALTQEVLKFPYLAGDSVRCLLSQLLGRLGMTT